jgi:hypothetical protein
MLMRSLVAAGAVALLAGSAHAGVTFIPGGPVPPALTVISNFSGSSPAATSGFSFSGTGQVFATGNGDGAQPAGTTGPFLVVEGGESETLTAPGAGFTTLAVYVGSLDSYNTFAFAGSPPLTGADLAGLGIGAVDSGNQSDSDSNGVFVFTFTAPVTSVTFSSSSNSLEIASIATTVPEPAAWALMLIGVAGIGGAMRSRRKLVATTA